MGYRALKSIAIAAACWAVATHLEDVARFFRIRDLSNPNWYERQQQT